MRVDLLAPESVKNARRKQQITAAVKQAGWCLLMRGKAEQRYSIQQGQCLDNATQMGQDELSILKCYVTPSAVSSGPPHVGVGSLATV